MAELDIEGLSLRFGGLTVLEGVSLAVEPAELFALIGPNGAGKTSVLNCIGGIYRGEGRIRFRGEDIAGLSPRAVARLGIAILIVEQSATVALEIADYGYVMENGRIVLDGTAQRLRGHPDIQEFYLGRKSGERRSYREVKQYRRSRRWYG